MLQRAASNAYHWWWASHIRTKQSKWLEQNLQDMEEKVANMLKIIDEEGDSFIQRAEMFYKKRPELVGIVEESYRAYRALAERYDSLSKDLQSANRTIASVFPDRVPFAMDEEDEENGSQASTSSSDKPSALGPNIPKPPYPRIKDFRSQSMLVLRKGQLRRAASTAKAASFQSSGLSKDEALDEIDSLQKEILTLQTEREFVKCSYEHGYEKLCAIEDRISDKQKRVCSLQEEFGIGTYIEDDEARSLMAARAIKSCQEAVAKLKDKHEESTEQARVESKRIKQVNQKFEAIRRKFNSQHANQLDKKHQSLSSRSSSDVDELLNELESAEKQKQDFEVLRKQIEENLQGSPNASWTMSQLAERIDDLVQRVITLETSVSSQNALVKRLRSDTDELQTHVKSLEEDKEAQIEGSEKMNNRINELEKELSKLKDLIKTVVVQNNSLKTHFTETSCNIDHLSGKLPAVKMMDEEVEKTGVDAKAGQGTEDSTSSASKDSELKGKEKDENHVDSDTSNKASERNEEEKSETDEEDDQPNWRQLYLSGLDDREKILLEEYSSVLRNYKDVKQKLNDVEKKNRDGFFELALQIRELKNSVASKDGEIQTLRHKMNNNNADENKDGNSSELDQESTLTETSVDEDNKAEAKDKASGDGGSRESGSPNKMGERVMQLAKQVSKRMLTVEEKIRSDIDDLLEENLEFWLRFSTSFHQIHKYQTSVQDLKAELTTLRERKHQEASGKPPTPPLGSEARPIYSHFREITTELTLWLENNAVLKDEVQGRYTSLCNIQEEISRATNVAGHASETELSQYQAAKFHGEVLNMKQENNKVANELKSGFDRVRQLKLEVEKIMEYLEREIGRAAPSTPTATSKSSKPRIPLRSFLFGIKLKKQRAPKMFACGHPTLMKQDSFIAEPDSPQDKHTH